LSSTTYLGLEMTNRFAYWFCWSTFCKKK